jgi:hypothetical protein
MTKRKITRLTKKTNNIPKAIENSLKEHATVSTTRSAATTLVPKSPTGRTLKQTAATLAAVVRSPAALDSTIVHPTVASLAGQVNPLNAVQVSNLASTVTTLVAKTPQRRNQPILSPYDTFAAHDQTTEGGTKSYENRIQNLHKLKKDLKGLEKDTSDFAKKQLKITKAENFLRKGKKTGGDYKEHELTVLDAKAAKAAKSLSDKEAKQRKAAEHHIMLANSRIIKFQSSLESLADKMKSNADKTKTLAAYKSAALNVLEEEKGKAKGIEDYLKANTGKTNPVNDNIDKQKKASAELIQHLQRAVKLNEAGFAEFEDKRRILSAMEANQEYELGNSMIQGGGSLSTSTYRGKNEDTTTSTPQDTSPYEIWLYKEAKEQYKRDNAAKGKKFNELSEEEQHKYNKQYVYANRSAKIKEYERSLSPAGKVEGYLDESGGKTFQVTGANIKFNVGSDGLLITSVEGDISELNAVVRVRRKKDNGDLSHISDMIEFKDGKIVGLHLNTEEDSTGPTKSQLNVSAIQALAIWLDRGATDSTLTPPTAIPQHSAPTVDATVTQQQAAELAQARFQEQTVKLEAAELAQARFQEQTVKLEAAELARARFQEQTVKLEAAELARARFQEQTVKLEAAELAQARFQEQTVKLGAAELARARFQEQTVKLEAAELAQARFQEQTVKLGAAELAQARLPQQSAINELSLENSRNQEQNTGQNVKKKLEERTAKSVKALHFIEERMRLNEIALQRNNKPYLQKQHDTLKQQVAIYKENSIKWTKEYEDNVEKILTSGQPQKQQQLRQQQALYNRLEKINSEQSTAINHLLAESLFQLNTLNTLESFRKNEMRLNGLVRLEEQKDLQKLQKKIDRKLNTVEPLPKSKKLEELFIQLKQSQTKLQDIESLAKYHEDKSVELCKAITVNLELASKTQGKEQLQYFREAKEQQNNLEKIQQAQEKFLLNHWHQLQLQQSGLQLVQQDAQIMQIELTPERTEELETTRTLYENQYEKIRGYDDQLYNQSLNSLNWAQLQEQQDQLEQEQDELDEQQQYLDSQQLQQQPIKSNLENTLEALSDLIEESQTEAHHSATSYLDKEYEQQQEKAKPLRQELRKQQKQLDDLRNKAEDNERLLNEQQWLFEGSSDSKERAQINEQLELLKNLVILQKEKDKLDEAGVKKPGQTHTSYMEVLEALPEKIDSLEKKLQQLAEKQQSQLDNMVAKGNVVLSALKELEAKENTFAYNLQDLSVLQDMAIPRLEEKKIPKEMEGFTSTTLSLDPAHLTTESREKRKQLQQQKAVVNTPIQPVQTQSNDHKITPDDDNSVKGKIAKYNAMIQAQALAAGSSIINISPNRIPNAHKKEVHSHKEKLKR